MAAIDTYTILQTIIRLWRERKGNSPYAYSLHDLAAWAYTHRLIGDAEYSALLALADYIVIRPEMDSDSKIGF